MIYLREKKKCRLGQPWIQSNQVGKLTFEINNYDTISICYTYQTTLQKAIKYSKNKKF